ncbi:unnamed protein product, partial [Ectocarpus sp. 13 AM-2016]
VNQKGGSAYIDLSQRLVLVENRPRLLELACSLVAPSLHPQPPSAAPAAAGMPAFVPGLVRKICSSDAPFPGKVVSRPCRVATEAKATVQQPSGWVSTMAQAWLSSAAGGGDAFSTITGGGGAGVCECAGRGPCTIRASPGREPCLHVEVGDVNKRGGRSGGGGGGGGGFSAESVESTSAVRLRTYSVATTTTGAASPRASSAEGRDAAAATAVSDALVALHAAAVRLGLPPSVAVPVYAAMLLAGVVLLLVAQPLSESRVFHYLLSALLGGVVGAAAVVLRAVKNPRRSLFRLLMLGGVVMWLVVAAGVDRIPSPAELLSNLPGVMLAFWRMGLSNFPWAGKAFFAASGLAGVLTTWRQGLFLEEADEARGTWFNGQACIRRVLTFSGIFLVYNGVSDTDVGMALVVLALMAPTLAHYARRYNMWCNSSKWYRAGNQLSQEEYEAQGDAYTREAIAALRESTCNDWSLTKK